MCERGVLSEYPAARARASYWFDNPPTKPGPPGKNFQAMLCTSSGRATARAKGLGLWSKLNHTRPDNVLVAGLRGPQATFWQHIFVTLI